MGIKNKPLKKDAQDYVNDDIKRYVYSLLTITLSVIGALRIGFLGQITTGLISYLFGNLFGIVYITAILLAVYNMLHKSKQDDIEKQVLLHRQYVIGFILLLFVWMIASSIPSDNSVSGWGILAAYVRRDEAITGVVRNAGGGLVGSFLASLLTFLFALLGTRLLLLTLFIAALIFICYGPVFERMKKLGKESFHGVKKYITDVKTPPEDGEDEAYIETEEKDVAKDVNIPFYQDDGSQLFVDFDDDFQDHDYHLKKDAKEEDQHEKPNKKEPFTSKFEVDYSKYKLPKITLLNAAFNRRGNTNQRAAQEAGRRLIEILEQFGVKATLLDTHIGPTVTKFEIKPDLGVRVNKISSLQYDIKMALAAKDIRIEAPIPGKSAVGIEIPNVEKTFVSMREMMSAIPEQYQDSKLLFTLGKDLTGMNIYGELDKMPHLLIAGATGSGKSVCLNAIIISILMRTKPNEVKLLLIDPKKVEFTPYRSIPHLLGPIVSNEEEANRSLKMIVAMMEQRYELFAKVGVRKLDAYNEYVREYPDANLEVLPQIVVVIDELADLMIVAQKDVEASIQRITQLARAAGIHLIVATQRPSVDVITGVIKSNIQSRIAFAVSSGVDSKTILDKAGADKLLGNGDMLYLPSGENNPIRIQGVFIDDAEIEAVCNYVCMQGKAKYDDNFVNLNPPENLAEAMESNDPLYEEVKRFVIETRKASTSLIQRKFSVGYARAARLMDTLELNGIISESRGSRPRDVLVAPIEDENEEL